MTIELTGASLLAGAEFADSATTFHAQDPSSNTPLEPAFAECGPDEVARAADAAWDAFQILRRTSPAQRADLLEDIATGLEQLGPQLSERVVAETALPPARPVGELARTAGQLRMFAADLRAGTWAETRVDPGDAARTPLPRPDIRQRAVAVGPVAVFGASNFPLAFSVAGGDTASALAAGCPVIVKAHPAHPGVSELVGRVIREAVAHQGLPAGTFSLLQGTSHELGTALVSHPKVRAVGFTGSRGGGMALVQAAAQRRVPIPVYAEMSAINPVFLLPGAVQERAEQLATGYVASLTGSGGQLCTKPGLVFAADLPETKTFLDATARAIADVPAVPLLTNGIRDAYRSGIARAAAVPGVEQLAQGSAGNGDDNAVTASVLVTDLDTVREHPELLDEIFGPAGLVVLVRTPDELVDATADLDGQLTATLQLGDADTGLATELLHELELLAGRILVNGWPTGVEVNHAMVHGGPFPATSAPATTSVGARAIERFQRPVAYQDVPETLLPTELADENPWHLLRRVDGRPTRHTDSEIDA